MANKKFSEFVLKTSTSDVSHIVGYNGAENVQITPANFVTGGGTGVFLPLAGGTMVGNTIHNDNVKSIYGSPGNELSIYNNGTNQDRIESLSSFLVIEASNLIIRNNGGTEDYAKFQGNLGVELYYDGSKKLETTSVGISVTGNGVFTGDVNITQSTDVGVLNTTNLESGAAVGLSLTYPTSNVDAGDGLAIAIGITGRGRSYIANSNLTNNLDASNLEFYTESGGVINKVLTLSESKDATFTGDVNVLDESASGIANVQIKGGVSGAGVIQLSGNGNAVGTDSFDLLQNSAGAFVYNRHNSPLVFATSNIERMRLDASGNLGLGVSNPGDYVSVSANNFVLGNTVSSNGITVLSGTTSFGNLAFADGTGSGSQYRGLIQYGHTLNSMKFFTESIERMVIDNAGNVGVGTSTPSEKLTVESAAGFIATFKSLTASDFRPIRFQNAAGSDVGYLGNDDSTDEFFLRANDQPLVFGSGSSGTERMRITSAGDLFLGTTVVPSNGSGGSAFLADSAGRRILKLSTTIATTIGLVEFDNPNGIVGKISSSGSSTIYATSSDYRLKEDLQDFKGLDKVSKIPVYDFKWKTDESRSYGVMAHQLQEVLPQAVTGDKDAEEMQSVDYSKIVPLLVKSIQELSAKLEALECQCEKK